MEKASETKRRGPRPAGSDTREAILAAAREQFAQNGYGRTTMRGVASAAGVDARLVTHYFGSKQELFMQSVQLPVDPDTFIARAFDGPPHELAERVARGLIGTLDDLGTRSAALAIIRAAASEPEAAEIMRMVLAERVLTPLAESIEADHAELRATLIATQFRSNGSITGYGDLNGNGHADQKEPKLFTIEFDPDNNLSLIHI